MLNCCLIGSVSRFAGRNAALAGLVLFLVAGHAGAAEVRLLQAPAWLERDGERMALRRGMTVSSGDRVVTGDAARALLQLEEGSLVKLGANAALDLDKLEPPDTSGGIFSGALNVLKGAFRFTTTLVDRKRNITTRLRSATIGIRGTDVWGKAEDARDFVVLLEGKITITREGTETTLDTPLSLFMAPRGQPALPVGPVDQDDLGRWAQETEPQAGAGIINEEGRFRLNVASYTTAEAAARAAAALETAGYANETAAVTVAGQDWWRVSVGGFATRADAAHSGAMLAAQLGYTSPWVDVLP